MEEREGRGQERRERVGEGLEQWREVKAEGKEMGREMERRGKGRSREQGGMGGGVEREGERKREGSRVKRLKREGKEGEGRRGEREEENGGQGRGRKGGERQTRHRASFVERRDLGYPSSGIISGRPLSTNVRQ